MKKIYSPKNKFLLLFTLLPFLGMAQQPTTVAASANCNFTYNFNSSDEGFSSPSIYSDPNDFGLYWDGTKLAETAGANIAIRTASTISGIFFNTESARSTLGFDYIVPQGTQYRVRIISGVTNPPLEILATTASGPLWTSFPATSGSLCIELQDQDLPLNVQIRYEITFRTITPGPISIDNFRRATANAPLPVTFLGFIARENSPGSINLLWNVGEEVNVRGYEIQSSSDGINFTTAGFVNASGKKNYSFVYNEAFKGNRYFRVRNVDVDNQYKYTGIIKVKNDDAVAGIKIYPVPASDQVYLEHKKMPQKASITVINSEGRVVLQTVSVPNSFQTSINISSLKAGMYFIKYDEGNGFAESIKFLKN